MTPNPEVHTLAGAYVVNALSEVERRQFERHLADCADCTEEVASLREVVAVFAGTVAEPPPEHLRAQVLAKTAVTRRLPPVVAGRDQPRKPLSRWLMPVAAALLVAATVAGVLFGYRATSTSADLNRQVEVLKQTQDNYAALTDLLAQPDAKLLRKPIPGGVATVVYSPGTHTAAMLGAEMPLAPHQHAYQGWVVRGDRMQSVGLSKGGKDGGAMLARDVLTGDQIAVTVEPENGSEQPTTPPVVTVTLA
ncbi:anti-sigma factor [Labedaea rhizosphaerae]|uniref:Regulator of SigK n=1 Tax=Labedaea rhizosphaerae TaxID=598644 RepID=A0A4R6S5R6_LABRH|nr:anti-sigma factor [Labedaea rhizosphaerae]TDP95001.1 anti-sigma-K factor RskA [Labedaea rhizosphaerae]